MNSVYYATWESTWAGEGAQYELSKIDASVINIAFVQPNTTYTKGQKTFAGTGLDFNVDFGTVVDAIALQRPKNHKFMLSIGGASYQASWVNFNAAGIIALAQDLGCYGIDIDWEGTISDQQQLLSILKILKISNLGGLKLSMACWSTGAYPKTDTDEYSGIDILPLQMYGTLFSWISIMAYDAGSIKDFDPLKSFAAYRAIYPGTILLGMEVGIPGWTPPGEQPTILQQADAARILNFINTQTNAGWMCWEYKAQGPWTYEQILAQAKTVIGSKPNPTPSEPPPPYTPTAPIACPNCNHNLTVSLSVN